MRILLDECIPRKLKGHFVGHECRTVPEAGWAGKKNGELLSLAEDAYDVFLTLDKGVQYQQNLSGRNIAVVVVRSVSNRIEDLIEHVPACLAAFRWVQPGMVLQVPPVEFEWPPTAGIDRLADVAADLMRRVFDFEPEDYWISDEADLRDLMDHETDTITGIQRTIEELYGVDLYGETSLLAICTIISKRGITKH